MNSAGPPSALRDVRNRVVGVGVLQRGLVSAERTRGGGTVRLVIQFHGHGGVSYRSGHEFQHFLLQPGTGCTPGQFKREADTEAGAP